MTPKSELLSLVSVGPATVEDLERLGISTITQLKGKSPQRLYDRLCLITRQRHDPCVLDVFAAAIAQADNPKLPAAQKQWHYWSRVRKKAGAGRKGRTRGR